MPHIKFVFAAGLLALLFASSAQSEPFFVESFESGDMSATNEEGFDWGRNNRTSVINSDGVVWSNGEKDVAMPEGREWDAMDGEHSLRVRYPEGQYMAEQRFDLGQAYKDLWLQYWVKVPINYFHGQNWPSNHKFFAIWMDQYSNKGDGPTVIWEFWGSEDGSSRLAYHYGEGGYTITGGHQAHKDFVSPADRGRWMEITIHVKASSTPSSEDGVIELWRRWENESSNERELFHRRTDALLPIPSGGPAGWSAGYFMGWANGSYAEDTEWLIDHIVFSEEPLINTEGLAPNNAAAPEPPVLQLKQ